MLSVSLLLFTVIRLVVAIPILDFDTTPIPYLIPRCFQTYCDRSDEFLPESNKDLSLREVTNDPYFYISSSSIRSKPNIWTTEPFCLESLSANKGFCVYTSSKLANGRGISIVATPVEANRIISALALQPSCQIPPKHPQAPKFDIKSIPGHGLGAIATSPLYRGDQIYSTSPILAIQDDVMQFVPTPDLLLLMAIALNRLPSPTQQLFWTMHAQFGGNAVYDRITTNAYTMPLSSAKDLFWAVQPEISRLNHDCRPNAVYHFDASRMVQNVHVVRPVGVGEEITVSYVRPLLGFEERRKRIGELWGFECDCSLCAASEALRNASDRRLGVMRDLEVQLDDLDPDRTGSTGMAELLISLYELERLDGGIADGYMYAALEYSYVGNRNGARMYAAKAMEAIALWRGVEHPYYRNLKRLFEDPEGHASWTYIKKSREDEIKMKLEGFTQVVRGLTGIVKLFEKVAPRLRPLLKAVGSQ